MYNVLLVFIYYLHLCTTQVSRVAKDVLVRNPLSVLLQVCFANGEWDLLLWAQNTLPAGDPAWFLRAFFRSDGGNNHAGLNSATVDGLLDTLADADVHAARVTATADAHAAILAEQAVSNLVTPEWHVSLSDCVVDYVPWGSDYYVIRPDLFVPAATPCTRPQLSSDGAGATRAVLAGAAALLAAVFLH